MKDKATAITIVVAILALVPVMATIAWLVLGGVIGYAFWHRKRFEKFVTDLKDVIRGDSQDGGNSL